MGAAMFSAFALEGIPEVSVGDDLVELVTAAIAGQGLTLEDGDILVVTSKIVSKAEGRVVQAADREEAITRETVRVVASRAHPNGVTRIVENRQGIIQAAAGVDASNTLPGTVLLLPEDPDASARLLCGSLRAQTGARIGVIISDTLGRAWREGQIDAAIGAAGVGMLDDRRGQLDSFGQVLTVTQAAVGDELASATDLVKGKASGTPVALVRGLGHLVVDSLQTPARALARSAETDMFRLGTDEAIALGRAEALAEPGLRSLVFRDIPRPSFAAVSVVPLPAGASVDPQVWERILLAGTRVPRAVFGLQPVQGAGLAEGRDGEVLIAMGSETLEFRIGVAVDVSVGLVRVSTAVGLKRKDGRLGLALVRMAHPVMLDALLTRVARRLSR
jgi:coenzyme F420-0:L-glutamate ligase/coenzyme F420-1:gamma-L-glutamate ligase